MKKLYFIFSSSLFFVSYARFETIQDLQTYAQTHAEFPPISNHNFINPNYTSYYKSLQSSWLLLNLPFTRSLAWKTEQFPSLLAQLSLKKSTEIQKLILTNPSRLFVFTNLYGSFHSLVRSLTYLMQAQIIDNTLRLKAPHDYFVINGNAIDIGPYSIETLFTILLLMKKNPKQIIYLRGLHETNEYWLDYGLMQEIQSYFSDYAPVQKALNTFFKSLAHTLLISSQDKKPYICINPDLEINSINTTDIRAIFTADNWLKEYRAKTGLALIGQYKGATTWSLLSAPVLALQHYLHYSQDAFIKITTQPELLNSHITLYNHPLQSKTFTEHASLNCITNRPASTTYNPAQDINFGSSMSLIRGLVVMSQLTKRGMDVRINEENTANTLHNQFMRTIVYNDSYTPYLARLNVNTLLEENTSMLLLPVGSPTLDAYIDYIKNNKILVLFPITGAPQFRSPELKGIIHLRASYSDEMRALIDHMITEYGARKFAFFYQNDAYGIGPLQAAHEQLKKHGIQQSIDIPYSRAQVNFKEQAEKINFEQPDAIGLISTTNPTQELIRQTGIDVLANKKLFGISPLAEELFRNFIKEHGIDVLFCGVIPNPKINPMQITKEYRAAMDRNNLPYDIFSLEAYIGTSLLIDILHHIKEPFTKEKIIEKLEALHNYSFKGLTLTFNPQQRSLANSIWIETGPNTLWIEKKIHQ